MAQIHMNKDFDSKMGSKFEAYAENVSDTVVGALPQRILDIQTRGLTKTAITIANTGKAPSAATHVGEVAPVANEPFDIEINHNTITLDGVDYTGTLIADGRDPEIRLYNNSGTTLLRTFQTPSAGAIATGGVSLDRERNIIYVATQTTQTSGVISSFTTTGVFISEFEIGFIPNQLEYLDDKLYVGQLFGPVHICTTDGTPLFVLDDNGMESDNIAVNREYLYVSYIGDFTRIYHNDGKYGVASTIPIQITGGMCVDDAGTLYGSTYQTPEFAAYTALGIPLAVQGTFPFNFSRGMTYDNVNQRIYAGEFTGNPLYFQRIDITKEQTSELRYALYGSAKYLSDPRDITTEDWVNILSVRNGGAYDHNYTQPVPFNTDSTNSKTFEEALPPWDRVALYCGSIGNATSVNAFSRGQR